MCPNSLKSVQQKLGRSSVQQLLRKLHIGSWDGEESGASPKQTPERQNSWESEHENEFLQERDQWSSNRLIANNTLQKDSNVDNSTLPLVVIGHGAGPYTMGRDGENEESAGFQVTVCSIITSLWACSKLLWSGQAILPMFSFLIGYEETHYQL